MNRPQALFQTRCLATFLLAGMALLCGCESASPGDPTAPVGGQEFVVDKAEFTATVYPLFTSKGCDNAACHGGGIRGSFQLSPFDDKNVDFDFEQASWQLNPLAPETSALLTKPLAEAEGGAAHTAASAQYGFMTTADPDYQAILAWIEAGELR